MSNEKLKAFDLEAIYDAEIAPLMSKIIDICKAHKLPMFATFVCANDPDDENVLCTTNLMFSDERPVPDEIRRLEPSLRPAPMLRMRVTDPAKGTIEDTIIIP